MAAGRGQLHGGWRRSGQGSLKRQVSWRLEEAKLKAVGGGARRREEAAAGVSFCF